jgi:hypothetical protein
MRTQIKIRIACYGVAVPMVALMALACFNPSAGEAETEDVYFSVSIPDEAETSLSVKVGSIAVSNCFVSTIETIPVSFVKQFEQCYCLISLESLHPPHLSPV